MFEISDAKKHDAKSNEGVIKRMLLSVLGVLFVALSVVGPAAADVASDVSNFTSVAPAISSLGALSLSWWTQSGALIFILVAVVFVMLMGAVATIVKGQGRRR